MKIHELVEHWARRPEAGEVIEVPVAMSIDDAAKLEALAEMFTAGDARVIMRDLIHAALMELEGGFAYLPGERVVEHDEQGDPIHEDVGLTPRFLELRKRHLARMLGKG